MACGDNAAVVDAKTDGISPDACESDSLVGSWANDQGVVVWTFHADGTLSGPGGGKWSVTDDMLRLDGSYQFEVEVLLPIRRVGDQLGIGVFSNWTRQIYRSWVGGSFSACLIEDTLRLGAIAEWDETAMIPTVPPGLWPRYSSTGTWSTDSRGRVTVNLDPPPRGQWNYPNNCGPDVDGLDDASNTFEPLGDVMVHVHSLFTRVCP